MTNPRSVRLEEAENEGSNPSENPTLGDIVAARLSRRDVVRGALAVSALASVGLPASAGEGVPDAAATQAHLAPAPSSSPSAFHFTELAVISDERDHVAPGYEADVLIRWGDGVLPGAPAFDPYGQSPETQAKQFGYNNDFLGFLPIDGRPDRGLLVVNHEYTNEELMFPGAGMFGWRRLFFDTSTPTRINIEMMAHGGSVLEVERRDGKWHVVRDSKYARRITAETDMRISGPAAGHERMRTSADPAGTRVKGMINNCGGGITPWGTWLSCEENVNYHFIGSEAAKASPDAARFKRYGMPANDGVIWGKVHDRFDIAKEPNEPNRFGWVVEIDPFDPSSTPVKRTAMGRFKHEGAGNAISRDGRFVVYQGDDERFDYVYRFVTSGTVDLTNPSANKNLLDQGTLFVARFDSDGRGEWLPLVHGTGKLNEENGFRDQGEVLIYARLAADALGATKMDRPEDVDVSPKTGRVYVMLTLNDKRKTSGDRGVDAANPRAENRFGHIIEITPDDGDHASNGFRWEILLRCGDPSIANVGAAFNPATTKDGWFANPDNCAFDADGRLWIATDGNSQSRTGRSDGIWTVDVEGGARGTAKCFYQVPRGAEMCGPCFTPDMETMFVAVQHPGERREDDLEAALSTFDSPSTRWPDFKQSMPPRPSIVVITRKGGGKIGA